MVQHESKLEKRKRWAIHIESWRKSGKTQAQYCRDQGLSRKLFYYWKSKFNDRSADGLSLVPIGIHPIQVHQVRSSFLVVNVGQYKVEIGIGFDSATLGRVIRVLEQV